MSEQTIGRNTIAGEMLRGFVERYENLGTQIKQLRDDQGVVMAEAKAANIQPSGVRYIVKKRKLKPSERAESEQLEDMYLHAMGMAADNPLFRAVGLIGVDITAKESVIEAMKKFVPANGSITVEAGGSPIRLSRDAEGNISVTEVIEKPVQQSLPETGKRPTAKATAPDVTPDVAESMGRQAFKDDIPIISNPFPFGDARRARWDKGWRDESGGDGMGPEED
jgi:uncharacterized protein (UPF0335 family)